MNGADRLQRYANLMKCLLGLWFWWLKGPMYVIKSQ